MWSGPKGASMQERLDRAAEAKKALLERFKKQPGPGDKEYEERQAQLKAVAEARRQREEARERQKAAEEAARAEAARLKAEADAKAAQEAAEKAAKLAAEEAAIMAALKAERANACPARPQTSKSTKKQRAQYPLRRSFFAALRAA